MNRDLIRVRWLNIGILLVILIALSVRLMNLTELPLGDGEAVHALNATQLTLEPVPAWSDDEGQRSVSPMYVWITSLIFQFSGSGELQARIVPAVAGILLALLPVFFVYRLPRLELLLCSGFLALSPVAINLSRSAGGMALSALFLMGALFWIVLPDRKDGAGSKWIWAAIFLGAGIASGTNFYRGFFSFLIAFLLIRWFLPEYIRSGELSHAFKSLSRYLWITPVVALILATGLASYRLGIAGMGEAIVAWLRGWVPFGQLSVFGFLLAGLVYEPFILVVGGIGAILAWRSDKKWGKPLALWALGSLIAALIYPGRAAQDWIWSLLPLAFLAAGAVTEFLLRLSNREHWMHVITLVSIALILISAALITLLGYVNGYLQQMLIGDPILIGLALGAMLLLLVSVFVLFGLGWSWDIVRDGAGIVIVLVTLAASISAAWKLDNDRELGFRTLWVQTMPTQNGEYFQSTLENASLALTGDATAAPLLIQGNLEPSVLWRLRNYPRFDRSEDEGGSSPPILIAPEGAGLGVLEAEYIGQSFTLTLERGWFGLVPPDLLRWTLTNSAPTASTGWVVYVRADIVSLSDFSDEVNPE
ncbi:MAG: glycosyltransferase family 39 protein [Anaerolineales bacterium]